MYYGSGTVGLERIASGQPADADVIIAYAVAMTLQLR